MMMTDPIRILMASDIHFGIPSISQDEMANAFVRTIFPCIEDTDIFFINGDLFDTIVPFDNPGFDPIYDTILNLFRTCDHHKVTLRLLQGTWTHDRSQCKRLVGFYRNGNFSFDFKFMEGIEFEEIIVRDRTLRVLYVQDNLPYTNSDDVIDVIQDRMRSMGWDYVDYACMHGFFDQTFPKNINQDGTVVFREEQFPFVRKIINVGHVHQYRAWGKVISNGSFDRASFGDEDPKGLIKVLDYPDHYTAQFVKNEHAAIYDTLLFTKDDTTETIAAKINHHLASLTTDRKISLRFYVDLPEHREAIKVWMRETHPQVRFQLKKSGESEDKAFIMSPSALFTPVKKRIAPTPGTIATFIRSYIPDEYPITIDQIEQRLLPIEKR